MVHRLRSRPYSVLRQSTASTPSCIRSKRPRPRARSRCGCSRAATKCWRPSTPTMRGYVQFEAGLARGEGALAPALLVATDAKGDYAFLNLKAPPFDLTDRGVSGRAVPAGLDAFVYHRARRLPLRRDRARHRIAARRAGCRRRSGVPLTLVVERPDGVEYRAQRGAGSGRRRACAFSVPLVPSAPTGTWRVRAFTDPKRPPVGEATFMVEDYVPDRLEFDLASKAKSIAKRAPAEVTLDGRYLYGAPAAEPRARRRGDRSRRPASAPGFPRYQFGLSDEADRDRAASRSKACRRPTTDGKAPLHRHARQAAGDHAAARGAGRSCAWRKPGGRAVERKLALPVTPAGPMIGVKPLFSGRSLGEGENATFDVIVVAPDGSELARSGLRYELLKIETRYQWYRRDGVWDFEPVKTTKRVADGQVRRRRRHAGAHLGAGAMGPLSARSVERRPRRTDHLGRLRRRLVCGGERRHARPARDRARQAGIRAGRQHDGCGHRAHRRQGHAQRDRRPADHHGDAGRAAGRRARARPGRQATGAPAPTWWRRLRRPLDAQAQRMPGRAIGVQWFCGQPQGAHARGQHRIAAARAAEQRAAHSGQDRRAHARRGGAHRRRRGRCRHPQPHQLQAAGARRLLSRPAPAHRRRPRPLRPADRRHAGHARPDQVGRRRLPRPSCKAARRPRSRSRSIPASSP